MKRFLIIISLVIMAVAGYWLWNNRFSYFFKGDMEVKEDREPSTEPIGISNDPLLLDDNREVDTSTAPEGVKITNYDCDQRCENRKKSAAYDYCRELCGLNEGQPADEKKSFRY